MSANKKSLKYIISRLERIDKHLNEYVGQRVYSSKKKFICLLEIDDYKIHVPNLLKEKEMLLDALKKFKNPFE